jgi:hypothetical protein
MAQPASPSRVGSSLASTPQQATLASTSGASACTSSASARTWVASSRAIAAGADASVRATSARAWPAMPGRRADSANSGCASRASGRSQPFSRASGERRARARRLDAVGRVAVEQAHGQQQRQQGQQGRDAAHRHQLAAPQPGRAARSAPCAVEVGDPEHHVADVDMRGQRGDDGAHAAEVDRNGGRLRSHALGQGGQHPIWPTQTMKYSRSPRLPISGAQLSNSMRAAGGEQQHRQQHQHGRSAGRPAARSGRRRARRGRPGWWP